MGSLGVDDNGRIGFLSFLDGMKFLYVKICMRMHANVCVVLYVYLQCMLIHIGHLQGGQGGQKGLSCMCIESHRSTQTHMLTSTGSPETPTT